MKAKKPKPTPREGDVFLAIRLHQDKYDRPPTLDEIGKKVGMTRTTVGHHLRGLKKKRLVKWKKGCPRTLQII